MGEPVGAMDTVIHFLRELTSQPQYAAIIFGDGGHVGAYFYKSVTTQRLSLSLIYLSFFQQFQLRIFHIIMWKSIF